METQTRVRQCAILVGGLGTRLGHLTANVPKPLLPVGDRPFLAWLLREASRFGITDVVLLTGHLSEVVENALPDILRTVPHSLRVVVSREPFQAGTMGALFHARPHLQDRFVLLNGDSMLDCGWLAGVPHGPDVLGCLTLRRVPDALRFGVVQWDGNKVSAFRDRPAAAGPGLVNAGAYGFDRRILDHVKPTGSLERDALPLLAGQGRLCGVEGEGWFIDIGVPAELARARAELPERLHRRALFLDRDGVLNVDHGWVGSRDRFEWVPGAKEAIRLATRRGWHVFVVTNQSGVARGFYDEAAVEALHDWMLDEVLHSGGTIDDLRHCPYHPDAAVPEYRRQSDWRKPAPGMILDLLRAWEADPTRSLLVGDQPTDMAAAAAAGVAGHLFPGGNLLRFLQPLLDAAP